MSIPTSFHGLRVNVDRGEKIVNKTHFTHSGDDNANELPSISHQDGRDVNKVTGYNTSSIPPLVRQRESPDKLVIWESEQQCSESELREFDILSCQEIHSYLGNRTQSEEEEDDAESIRDGKDEGPMSISSSSTASSASTGVRKIEDGNKEDSKLQRDKEKGIGCRSSEELDKCMMRSVEISESRTGRDRQKVGLKESKSETNVFVSSLSAVTCGGSLSSVLNLTREESLMSLPIAKPNPSSRASNSTSVRSSRRASSVDANQNSSPAQPQDQQDFSQYCSQEQSLEEMGHYRNLPASDGGLGHRRKAGFEERVLPPRRQQLVRPLCQTDTGRERDSTESRAQQTGTGTTSLNILQESQSNRSNWRFTRSALREPSDLSHLYNAIGIPQLKHASQTPQKETQTTDKQPTAATQHLPVYSNPSLLERKHQAQPMYQRNCSSPNKTGVESKSSTPPHSPLRTSQGSPRRQPSTYLISRNIPGATKNIQSGCNPTVPTSAQGYGNSWLRAPVKTNTSTSGIPKAPINSHQSSSTSSPRESSPSPKLKPKGVRPKIITYVRKTPQPKLQSADAPYHVSSLPSRLTSYNNSSAPTTFKDSSKDTSKPETDTRGAPVFSASNPLYDKYCQVMQMNSLPVGMQSRNVRAPGLNNTVPPAHAQSHNASPKLGSRAENSYETSSEVGRSSSYKGTNAEDALQTRTAAHVGGTGTLSRSGRGLRLGLGAVRTVASSTKTRGPGQEHKSALINTQLIQPVSPAINQKGQESSDAPAVSLQAPAAPPASSSAAQPPPTASRSLLPKVSQSGLRPPGFSSNRLPAGRLAAFGFVRSSSVSSASSAHSADSGQSDTIRTPQRSSVSEEPPLHRVTSSPSSTDTQREPRCPTRSLQPPSTPALPRRFLPPQPRSSPGVGRKEFQRSSEVTRSLPSSPKRLAVVPPKLQSPVQPGQRPAAAIRGSTPAESPRHSALQRLHQEHQENLQREKDEAQLKERERQAEAQEKEAQKQEVERLQGLCEEQERQLKALREELKKTSLGLEAFIITTQQFCLKNEAIEEHLSNLLLEMQKAKEEAVTHSARWERLQQDKTALEEAFERELQELQLQQEAELAAVEESLRKFHTEQVGHLKADHRLEMEELRAQQQEQVEEMTVSHQAAMQELRDMHNITMATLHEEHARTMRDLRKAHDQQKNLLEEEFGTLRLSLQDQVDTLTFQNQSLKDKAKRFEEALRRSTDEQIIEALAPYQHIEQDLKSLKQVVEMKNQQIHQQEKKISDLEKVAQKNVFLEEKVQVLQQQNEDLKARIEMNLSLSRQLSEDNANLQESVEKENTEKKRLSRNNEELLWLLQTSPLMSPASSPLHRSFSTSPVPSSPLFSPSPLVGCDSPTHCHGCPKQAQYCSPSHKASVNQNLSPGPATPSHRAAANQNYSSSPDTPTHRVQPGCCNANKVNI